jgi:hypothetical protein
MKKYDSRKTTGIFRHTTMSIDIIIPASIDGRDIESEVHEGL